MRTGRHPAQSARGAFSLAELVVSIGILILMLGLAGQVFNFTIESTGQATALTEINQALRVFEDMLRGDLRHVRRGESIMLIQGNPVNGYWTQNGKDADDDGDPSNGYPHPNDPEREDSNGNLVSPRADMLMFFATKEARSYVDPQIRSHIQQIVYGHATMGEYKPDTANPNIVRYKFEKDASAFPADGAGYPSATAVSPIPASRWHLARRNTLFSPAQLPAPAVPLPLNNDSLMSLRNGSADSVGDFRFKEAVLHPYGSGPWYLPQWLVEATNAGYARSEMDAAPPAMMAGQMAHYMLPNCASFKVEWALDPRSEFVAGRLDGAGELIWFDPGDQPDPKKPNDKPDPLRTLQSKIDERKGGSGRCQDNDRTCWELESLLYSASADGSYDPGCIRSCTTLTCTEKCAYAYSLSNRFRGPDHPKGDPDQSWPQLSADGRRPNLVVFTAGRPTLGPDVTGPGNLPDGVPDPDYLNTVPDPMFPGALRITVDVFDRAGRLDRPIRHVMVIPVGE